MTYPTPYTVGWHTASDGAADPRGHAATVFSPSLVDGSDNPVNGSPVAVMGWAPTRQDETGAARVESDLDLYVPSSVSVKPKDVVDVPLDRSVGRFEVVAYPEDWSYGPFGFRPGSVIKLKRIES